MQLFNNNRNSEILNIFEVLINYFDQKFVENFIIILCIVYPISWSIKFNTHLVVQYFINSHVDYLYNT